MPRTAAELILVAFAALPFAQDDGDRPVPNTEEAAAKVDRAAARAALARTAERLEQVRVITADYVQLRETILRPRPVVSKGKLLLRREPACMVMRVSEPGSTVLRSDETSLLVWPGGDKPAERFVFEKDETVTTVIRCLTGDVQDLEKTFTIEGFEPTDELFSIELVPKDESLRERMPRLTLGLTAKSGLPAAVEYETKERESVRIELAGVVADPEAEVEDAVFDEPLPPGVEIVTRRLSRDG